MSLQLLGRRLAEKIKKEQERTVSQLRFDLTSLQTLVFEKCQELRCVTCYHLFRPEEFASHVQGKNGQTCSRPLGVDEYLQSKERERQRCRNLKTVSETAVQITQLLF